MCRAVGTVVSVMGPFRPGVGTICHSFALDWKFLQRPHVRTIAIPTMASKARSSLNPNVFCKSASPFASPPQLALLLSSRSNDVRVNHSTIRPFSLLTQPPVFGGALNGRGYPRELNHAYGVFYRQFHPSQSRHYDRLQNLEDAANRDRDNANAQAVFLQVCVPFIKGLIYKALLDKHPEYVVKRYESGGVATNTECDSIYTQALEKIARRSSSSYRKSPDSSISNGPIAASRANVDVQRLSKSQDNARQIFAGMKGNPVHVIVDEGIDS
jgi:hypothetical protein